MGSDGALRYVLRPGWAPAVLPTEDQRQELQRFVGDAEAYLKPAAAGFIAARIGVMLTHFYLAPLEGKMLQAVLADWERALAPYPRSVIEGAVDERLRAERQKPTPADLVALCEERVGRLRRDLSLAARLLAAGQG